MSLHNTEIYRWLHEKVNNLTNKQLIVKQNNVNLNHIKRSWGELTKVMLIYVPPLLDEFKVTVEFFQPVINVLLCIFIILSVLRNRNYSSVIVIKC